MKIDGVSYDVWISIHALLAESDTDMAKRLIEFRISIHALLAESDGKTHKLGMKN